LFENILGQNAAGQLILDIKNRCLAPAMLFEGPVSGAKGSTALELGRIISCEKDAAWSCSCSSCSRYRLLLHPDMLCIGSRFFSAEIAAACNFYIKDGDAAKTLLIRSVRKLLSRFNPVLWEDEPKFSKLGPLLISIEEYLDEISAAGKSDSGESAAAEAGKDDRSKLAAAIIKDTRKLESEGIPDLIPIAWIRRAAYWSRLAPAGREKLLLIENADRMQEGARNSLLKLLEEPPETVKIILASSRPRALLPTVLSRIRPYRFAQRSIETEKDVIRRIFHDENFLQGVNGKFYAGDNGSGSDKSCGSLISAYLDTFMPVSGDVLNSLAAYFAASASYSAAVLAKRRNAENLPGELVNLGKYASAAAQNAGLEKTGDGSEAAAVVLEKACNFEIKLLFGDFIKHLLTTISDSQKITSPGQVNVTGFLELWRTCAAEAADAVLVYNQNITLVLEQLFLKVSRGMAQI